VAYVKSDEVRAALGLDGRYAAWLDDLDAAGPSPAHRRPWTPDAALDNAAVLAIPADATSAVAAAGQIIAARPELHWLLDRCRSRLGASLGDECPTSNPWPALPAHLGAVADCFYVHVFSAALPEIRAFHDRLGVPPAIAQATLADLGRHMRIDAVMHGRPCLDSQGWLQRHWRGVILEVGRLQFEWFRHGAGHLASPAATAPDQATLRQRTPTGASALDVHIPFAGPLTPALCDVAIADAHRLFEALFPDRRFAVATCTSWLLDEQLREYLPADSNIIRFQRRFAPVDGAVDGTDEMHRFIFQRPAPYAIEQLPQRTTLERAFVAHLRRGGRWLMRTGWFAW
jgi:GNAT-like C-terminal domain/N-acyltransferase N-terminal domain